MRITKHRPVMLLLITVVLAGACTSSSNSLLPSPSGSTTPSATLTRATATPVPAAPPTSATAPSPGPTANGVMVGGIAETVVDRVRVRSQPRISDDSIKYAPLLPRRTQLYVLDGPVSESGYVWYEVVPLTSLPLPVGWVASADRDGVPWLGEGRFVCPPTPDDFRALVALPRGVGLACFPQVPITVEAGVLSCNCDADGGSYTPDWFFLGSGSPDLLVEPGMIGTGPPSPEDWFPLNLDPAGEHPDVLPLGQVVEVTGMFDHPAATACTLREMDSEPVPSQGCRMEFAVTRLLVRGP